MDSNFFQAPFDLDFFPSIRFPNNSALSDPFNIFSRRKDSLMSLGSPRFKAQMPVDFSNPSQLDNNSLVLPPKGEDFSHEQANALKLDSHLKNWQATASGPVDGASDPYFNRDLAFDAYQICRSRGGSFNFGRFRRDSEDLFHSNPDFFKNLSNITDTRNTLENAFQSIMAIPRYRKASEKFSFNPQAHEPHSPRLLMENHIPFGDDIHGLNLDDNMYALSSMLKHEGLPMTQVNPTLAASAKNTGSTMDSADEDEDNESQQGKKKVRLNDRSEAKVEAKTVGKLGRPKKVNSEQVKLSKTKASKQSKKANIQETSSVAAKETIVKAEQTTEGATNNVAFPNSGMIEGFGQLKMPSNIKQIIEGPNVPKGVQEFFKNSYSSFFETKKIGTLTVAERKAKVEKYLEKRKKRSWSRRVNYDCRKRVADNRLRIKGRFVTRDQAFVLLEELGIQYDPETITNPEIKTILTEKMGGSTLKKRKIGEQIVSDRQGYNEKEEEYDEDDE